MAKKQDLSDIIRDVLSDPLNFIGTGPSRKFKRKYKSGLPMVRDDAPKPRPTRTGPRKPKKNVVSENAANKGTRIMVPRPKGDRRAYARYRTVYGSGKTGGMR